MKNTLYRIEPTMRLENPELGGTVMITCNGGALFAELHPVHIKAKAKGPCDACQSLPVIVEGFGTRHQTGPRYARYCFNCGRKLPKEEAQP